MVKQLIFDLPVKTAFGRADFFVSDSNETAVKMLTRVGSDAPVALILVGESGAGKSHLARIWADDCGAEGDKLRGFGGFGFGDFVRIARVCRGLRGDVPRQ